MEAFENRESIMDNTPEPCPKFIYRCSKCGSIDVLIRAWVAPNNDNKYDSDCSDTDMEDNYCNYCDEHSRITPHSVLMEEINDWWKQTDGEDREVITGFDNDDSGSEDEYDTVCQACWDEKTDEQKIEIWKIITNRED